MKIRDKGCEINREISDREKGLSDKRKGWKCRGRDSSSLKKTEARKGKQPI